MMKGLLLMLAGVTALLAQGEKIRVIAFGAHPDDCDIRASGTAALFAAAGHAVKFVSVTNGDVGHQTMQRAAMAAERQLGKEKFQMLLEQYRVAERKAASDVKFARQLQILKQQYPWLQGTVRAKGQTAAPADTSGSAPGSLPLQGADPLGIFGKPAGD